MREKSSADRCRKLNQLVECQGYDSVDDLLATVISDSVSLAICLNEGCDYPVLSGF